MPDGLDMGWSEHYDYEEQVAEGKWQEILSKATELGRDAGQAAGSWVIDGNTTDETIKRILKGIEEGDPEILDILPSSPLSGEYADDWTPTKLYAELGYEPDDGQDEVCTAFEQGYSEGVESQVVADGKARLPFALPEH